MSLRTIRLRATEAPPLKARIVRGATGPAGPEGPVGPEGPPGEVTTENAPVAGEFARFTGASTIEGRTAAEMRADLDLETGVDVQAYDADLAALAGIAGTGLLARTADGAAAARSIAAGAGLAVQNGDGAAGNPTIALSDAELLALAGLSSAPDRLPYFTGAGSAALATFTAAGRALLDDADAAAQRTTLELVGRQTIFIPAAAMTPRITNGAASGSLETSSNDVTVKYLAFDSTVSEAAQIGVQMPKSWNEGAIVAQFVWTHPSTTTNFGIRFGIRAVAIGNDDALDAAFGAEQEVADSGGTTHDVYISDETAAMTVGGAPAAEELVLFEVYRDPGDAADTMAVDAYLLGVKLHYTTDAARDD